MNQEVKTNKNIWDKVCENLTKQNEVKVDNERIEKILKGRFIFGFNASDLLILLSALLTLIFLQLQPYVIPYLEGTLGKPTPTVEVQEIIPAQKIKTSSQSAILKSTSPSSDLIQEKPSSTSSSQSNF